MIAWLRSLGGRSLMFRAAILGFAPLLALLAIGPLVVRYGGFPGLAAAATAAAALLCRRRRAGRRQSPSSGTARDAGGPIGWHNAPDGHPLGIRVGNPPVRCPTGPSGPVVLSVCFLSGHVGGGNASLAAGQATAHAPAGSVSERPRLNDGTGSGQTRRARQRRSQVRAAAGDPLGPADDFRPSGHAVHGSGVGGRPLDGAPLCAAGAKAVRRPAAQGPLLEHARGDGPVPAERSGPAGDWRARRRPFPAVDPDAVLLHFALQPDGAGSLGVARRPQPSA